MDLDHERRLTVVESRSKSNEHRIDNLEKSTEAINRLATSMEVMVVKQDEVAGSVEKLDEKVSTLESKPARRWDALVEKIVLTIAAVIIGWALSKIGF